MTGAVSAAADPGRTAAGWKTPGGLTWLLVAAGAVCRVAQYLANRSLWLDEAFLASNILRRDYRGLLRPLDLNQAAPPGFLLLEKLATQLFGFGEYSLRLLPLLAGLIALVLFRRVASRTLPPAGAALAVALFAFGDPLIYYASELKQYSVDVAVALVLLSAALAFSEDAHPTRGPAAVLAIGGAAAVWLSHPAIFVLAGLGTTLAIAALARRDWRRLSILVPIGLVWGASFFAVYRVSLQGASANPKLTLYWAPNFLPFPPRSLADLMWVPSRLGELFRDPAGFVFRGLGILCFLVGCVWLFPGQKERLGLLLSPLLFTLAGSALQKYPFYGRLLLFLVPFVLLLVAEGAERIRALTSASAPSVGVLLLTLLLFHPAVLAVRFLLHPRTREEMKPVLAYIREKQAAGDGLYVYGGAAPAFDYYGPRYGFPPGRAVLGYWWREIPAYRKDLDPLRGRGRVWFLLSHPQGKEGEPEEKPFVSLLDGMGRRLDSFHAFGAAAYLYDLSR